MDYRHAQRHFQYNHEQGSFRGLSVTTKAYAAYFRNLVDPVGGWLELCGRTPADAFRHHCSGHITRSDHRLLRRATAELLEQGYLVLGELDETGAFLPLGEGGYVAIDDWIPAEKGMSRHEAEAWYAERDERAARYRARMGGDDGGGARTESDRASPERDRCDTDGDRTSPERDRTCTDRSPSQRNCNGTELALYHTIPDRIPPLSPKGESAGADRRAGFSAGQERSDVQTLAARAVQWLNAQHQPRREFQADSAEAVRQARRWLKAGWDWRIVQAALELRLTALKAAKAETWASWATPGTLFNRKLGRYVDEARAGHTYGAAIAEGQESSEARQAAERSKRLVEEADAQRQHEAELAFADVLEVAELVGPDGDWVRELPHSRARTVIRAIGWPRVAAAGEAMRGEFVQRYLGRM